MTDFEAVRWATAIRADIKIFLAEDERCRMLYQAGKSDPMTDTWKAADFGKNHAASNIHRHLNHNDILALCEWIVAKVKAE